MRSLLREKAARVYRMVTSPVRRLPDFIIIGVVKGGTTSLLKYLSEDSSIVRASVKEIQFFGKNKFGKKSILWYRSHFPLSTKLTGSKKMTGEASPQYFCNPLAPQRIKQLVPNAKLILLLRNPIERAYSHYSHRVRLGRETRGTFAELVGREEEILQVKLPQIMNEDGSSRSIEPTGCMYLSSGIYILHLLRWLKVFPKENLLVLKSENMFENTADTFKEVGEFIGVYLEIENQSTIYNSGSYSKLDSDLRKRLYEFFEPYNQLLYNYTGENFNWD